MKSFRHGKNKQIQKTLTQHAVVTVHTLPSPFQKTGFSQLWTVNNDLLFGFILQCWKHCHYKLSPCTVLPYVWWTSVYMHMLSLFLSEFQKYSLPKFTFPFVVLPFQFHSPCLLQWKTLPFGRVKWKGERPGLPISKEDKIECIIKILI